MKLIRGAVYYIAEVQDLFISDRRVMTV